MIIPRLVILACIASVTLSACGRAGSSALNEAINPWNRPENLPGATAALRFDLASLPSSGSSAHPTWTGSWWPYSQGGVAKRPAPNELSALEKYDAVSNQQGLATAWELQQSQLWGGYSWAGHCNGLAAAGTMTQNPTRGVNYRGVDFSADDVRALLVELWQGGGQLVGGRCDEQFVTVDPLGRFGSAACRDLNPGTFHVNLGNFLGLFRTPLIIDVTALDQVWNYPIVSYQVLHRQDLSAADANSYLGAFGYDYAFNPSASAFVYFRTQIQLATGVNQEYDYIIEMDQQGQIIGGEWVGASKSNHPDFMWRHTSPRPDNPHIDQRIIEEIHSLSL